jgi:hypothetical protein
MGEKWFEFVKRIHKEGQKKNAGYLFKEAMADASKRKSEWNKDGSSTAKSSPSKKARKSSKSKKTMKGGKKTRKSRKSKKNSKL